MSAKPIVTKLVTTSLAPLLKEHGFKKDALTFTRQRGDVLQIINIQISHGGASFYVNVGLLVGAMKKLKDSQTMGCGKYAVPLGLGRRLEDFVRTAASFKAVPASGDTVRKGLEKLLPILEPLDSATAILDELDLSEGFYKVTHAQLAYVLGDKKRALADLRAVLREFSDRKLTLESLSANNGMKF
jgi:hypothetical protein